jgi:hypothetical protein
MFRKNKYTTWYYNIIDRAKSQERKKLSKDDPSYVYYESHHIIPKSMGGTEEVLLTGKEHFICHIMLPKMCVSERHRQQMLNALNKMNQKNPYQGDRYFNSRLYQYLKKYIVYSEDRKNKQKNIVSCKNIITGEYLQVFKNEFDSNPDLVGVRLGCETGPNPKHSELMKKNNPFRNKKHSDEVKRLIGQKNSEQVKGRIWVTDGKIVKRCYPDSIPEGFIRGRK